MFVKDDKGNLTKHDTCFNFRTVGEQLTEIGVDWRTTQRSLGQSGYFWNAFNGIHDVFHTEVYWHEHAANPVDRLIDGHQGERAAGRHVGHAAASSCPTTRRAARRSPTTG